MEVGLHASMFQLSAANESSECQFALTSEAVGQKMLVFDVLMLELVFHHVSKDSEHSGVHADVAEELQDHHFESSTTPQERFDPR